MNIQQAKQEITDTLRAYLAKDEYGNYLIPPVRQRPILLMGPPGIGKTQVMEQIAAETDVGLVAYTITHHTRQSAIGLPMLEKRSYAGEEYTVTEYTMSEILASVFRLMETTGLKEGILFLDEINCVSETLAPMMLQFLQCKTFGNQRLPEGWLIAAAGNPPEYNKSVRDFDVVTLDRVKRIDVEEDYAAWRRYAVRKGLHGAILSYLELRRENFYRIENTPEGMQFVTARGWEDLSELLLAYEKLGIHAGAQVVGQYLQHTETARDFADYLSLYEKYRETYRIDSILAGEPSAMSVAELRTAPFDEKLSVLGLLLSQLAEGARNVRQTAVLCEKLYEQLCAARDDRSALSMAQRLAEAAEAVRQAQKLAESAGQSSKESRNLQQREAEWLDSCARSLKTAGLDGEDAMAVLREQFNGLQDTLDDAADKESGWFDAAFSYLEASVGQSQELVLFVTEVTAGYDTAWFVEQYGCDAYFRHNRELLFDDAGDRIRKKIEAAEAAGKEKIL